MVIKRIIIIDSACTVCQALCWALLCTSQVIFLFILDVSSITFTLQMRNLRCRDQTNKPKATQLTSGRAGFEISSDSAKSELFPLYYVAYLHFTSMLLPLHQYLHFATSLVIGCGLVPCLKENLLPEEIDGRKSLRSTAIPLTSPLYVF